MEEYYDHMNSKIYLSATEPSQEHTKKYKFYINQNKRNKEYNIPNNQICQSKYNIITFLPKVLLLQFFKLENVYFLIITILQIIPIISPLTSSTAIVPLAFVLSISIMREGFEDYQRHLYDDQLNSEKVLVYRDNKWKDSISGELNIGEIVLVQENEQFPADIILLDSSLANGICYIETATLDGEKTIKLKSCPTNSEGKFQSENGKNTWKDKVMIVGHCECDIPSFELYKFNGHVDFLVENHQIKTSLDSKNLLLKGAILKNTKWIIGFICYTGHSTKLVLNSKKHRIKYSNVERLLSKLIISVLFLQFFLCALIAILHYKYSIISKMTYLPFHVYNSSTDSILIYFTYTLLLNTMIPISLVITLEIVRGIQGYFISVDVEMYSQERQKFCKAGAISLNDALGQVNYIFSDKTGTLTCNKMEFKYCVIEGEKCYEYNKNKSYTGINDHLKIQEERKMIREKMDILEIGPNYFEILATSDSWILKDQYPGHVMKLKENESMSMEDESTIIKEYWKALSLAHECIIDDEDHFQGVSPDDIEILNACKNQGFEFIRSDSNNKRAIKVRNHVNQYEVLNILEFSSDRKRMSIIVKDQEMIKLYIKGADTEVLKRLSSDSNELFVLSAKKYVDYFSERGYRTLLVGMRIINSRDWSSWNKKLEEANLAYKNKDKSITSLFEEIESEIYLLGATIVEDKLQDKVPETIRDLRFSGIKIWMLTGDKLNTAFNIGLSCGLITPGSTVLKLTEETNVIDTLIKEYQDFIQLYPNQPEFSIIVNSLSLIDVFKSKTKLKRFLDIAINATSVICCRVTPLQKAEIVKATKDHLRDSVTLSIGDGGNDVSMIMEADIGVYGEEGMRAVQASDYAIGEFKYLRRLLLFHGRINYYRITEMIFYFFYKNFVFTINHFYFGFFNNFSGQTVIDDWFISLFNLIFTSFPLIARAVLDQDLLPTDGNIMHCLFPILYLENRNYPNFTVKEFIINIIRGSIHGIINFFVIIYTLDKTIVDDIGNTPDLWYYSVNIFTNIILIVNVRILLIQKYYTWINVIVMIITSFLSYFVFLFFAHNFPVFNSYGTMIVAFSSPVFYLNLILIVGSNFLLDFLTYCAEMIFIDSLYNVCVYYLKKNGALNEEMNLPTLISDYVKLYNYNVIVTVLSKVEGKSFKQKISNHDKLEEIHNSTVSKKKLVERRAKSMFENLWKSNADSMLISSNYDVRTKTNVMKLNKEYI